jgi:hypothetical protein
MVSVEAGAIPAAPHAKHQGNQLLVNCVYHDSLDQLSPASQFASARADTLTILQLVVSNKMLDGIVSVCVSFYVGSGSPRARPRRRLYRYSIFTSSILPTATTIDASCFLPSSGSVQSSEVNEISALLRAVDPEPPP